jgi:hypothetical protein
MRSFQRLAAITDTTANLIAQLRELEGLRERVRKAELASRRRLYRRKRTRIRRLELGKPLTPPLNRSGNRRSVSPT